VKRILTKTALSIIFISLFAGWGKTGHTIINRNITVCFPSSMNFPAYWSDTLRLHASDADNRKGKDQTESTRHFIDIDDYPEFVANDSINRDYDAFVLQHGSTVVIDNGVLPWAIIHWKDSLTKAFKQLNWHQAMMLSADIGHYVGDGHQPLHCTKFFNLNGVHSRYESDLVGQYQSNITYTNDKATYVSDVSQYAFNFIYLSNKYVDSTLHADSVATALDPTQGTLYLQKYWDLCGNQIIQLMKTASRSVADLIYTAWVDAGSPDPNGTTPVELVSFTASTEKGLINLKWKTATELNNTGFDIERGFENNSSGDIIFTKIGFVKGAGNSVIPNNYSFSDKLNNSGIYYYRLKQIDNDGSFKFSTPVEVDFNSQVNIFYLDQNYPNPFNPSTTIAYSLPEASNVKLSVFNALGQQVKIIENVYKNAGNYKLTFNANDFNSGIYFYKIEAGQFSQIRKMILLK
jgi:Secretion system C-terminal sorting domain